MNKKLINSKPYQNNWDNIFSEDAKLKEKQLKNELLERERLYALELLKKEEIEKQKAHQKAIKNKFKSLL